MLALYRLAVTRFPMYSLAARAQGLTICKVALVDCTSHSNAMSSTNGKRLRSLASALWDSDGDAGAHATKLYHRPVPNNSLEVAASSVEKDKLDKEMVKLRDTVNELRDKLTSTTLQLFEVQKYVVPLGGQPGPRTTPVTETSWIEDNKDLLLLPRMQQFLEQLDNHPLRSEISFQLCSQGTTTASRILKHGEWLVSKLLTVPAVFKIGITENPLERWSGRHYSYKLDPYTCWDGMMILSLGQIVSPVDWWKATLSAVFWGGQVVETFSLEGSQPNQALDLFLPIAFSSLWPHR